MPSPTNETTAPVLINVAPAVVEFVKNAGIEFSPKVPQYMIQEFYKYAEIFKNALSKKSWNIDKRADARILSTPLIEFRTPFDSIIDSDDSFNNWQQKELQKNSHRKNNRVIAGENDLKSAQDILTSLTRNYNEIIIDMQNAIISQDFPRGIGYKALDDFKIAEKINYIIKYCHDRCCDIMSLKGIFGAATKDYFYTRTLYALDPVLTELINILDKAKNIYYKFKETSEKLVDTFYATYNGAPNLRELEENFNYGINGEDDDDPPVDDNTPPTTPNKGDNDAGNTNPATTPATPLSVNPGANDAALNAAAANVITGEIECTFRYSILKTLNKLLTILNPKNDFFKNIDKYDCYSIGHFFYRGTLLIKDFTPFFELFTEYLSKYPALETYENFSTEELENIQRIKKDFHKLNAEFINAFQNFRAGNNLPPLNTPSPVIPEDGTDEGRKMIGLHFQHIKNDDKYYYAVFDARQIGESVFNACKIFVGASSRNAEYEIDARKAAAMKAVVKGLPINPEYVPAAVFVADTVCNSKELEYFNAGNYSKSINISKGLTLYKRTSKKLFLRTNDGKELTVPIKISKDGEFITIKGFTSAGLFSEVKDKNAITLTPADFHAVNPPAPSHTPPATPTSPANTPSTPDATTTTADKAAGVIDALSFEPVNAKGWNITHAIDKVLTNSPAEYFLDIKSLNAFAVNSTIKWSAEEFYNTFKTLTNAYTLHKILNPANSLIHKILFIDKFTGLQKGYLTKWNPATDPDTPPIKEKYTVGFIKDGKFDVDAFFKELEDWRAETINDLKNFVPEIEKAIVLLLKSNLPTRYEHAACLYRAFTAANILLDDNETRQGVTGNSTTNDAVLNFEIKKFSDTSTAEPPATVTPLFIADIKPEDFGLTTKTGKTGQNCYYIDGKYTASWAKYYDALKTRWAPAIQNTVEYKILNTFGNIASERRYSIELFSMLNYFGKVITNYSKLACISSAALQAAAENDFLDVKNFEAYGNDKSALNDYHRDINNSLKKYSNAVTEFNKNFAPLMECKKRFDAAVAPLAELVKNYPEVWQAMQGKEFYYNNIERQFIPSSYIDFGYAVDALKFTDADFFTPPPTLDCNFIDFIELKRLNK